MDFSQLCAINYYGVWIKEIKRINNFIDFKISKQKIIRYLFLRNNISNKLGLQTSYKIKKR